MALSKLCEETTSNAKILNNCFGYSVLNRKLLFVAAPLLNDFRLINCRATLLWPETVV